jgi:predicted negative regulator of RcsB-dependent stress response
MPENLQTETHHHEEEVAHILEPVVKKLEYFWREIIVAVVVIIGALVLYAVAAHVQDKAEEKAWEANFRAEYESEELADDKLVERLVKAREENPEANAGFYSCMRELTENYNKSMFDKSEAAAKLFLQRFPNHFFASQVRLSLAKVLLAEGKAAEARAQVETVLKSGAKYLESEANLTLAFTWLREAETATEKSAVEAKLEKARERFLDVKQVGRSSNWFYPFVETASNGYVIVKDRLENPNGVQFVMPEAEKKALDEAKKVADEKAAAEAAAKKLEEEKTQAEGKKAAGEKAGATPAAKPEEKKEEAKPEAK